MNREGRSNPAEALLLEIFGKATEVTEKNPVQDNSFDEYDHDFEPYKECANCGEAHENCECDEFEPEEREDIDECNECGLPESDPTHGESE